MTDSTARNAQTFEEIAAPLLPSLRHFLGTLIGDPVAADDLVQETLVRMERGLPGFAGRSSVKTWAFAIATRVAADHFRGTRNQVPTTGMGAAEDLPETLPSVEDRLITDEMNACIRDVIDGLPTDYGAALILHDLEGLTARETAEACDCSLETAKIRIHRARRKLKTALDRECAFYRDDENTLRCDRKQTEIPEEQHD